MAALMGARVCDPPDGNRIAGVRHISWFVQISELHEIQPGNSPALSALSTNLLRAS